MTLISQNFTGWARFQYNLDQGARGGPRINTKKNKRLWNYINSPMGKWRKAEAVAAGRKVPFTVTLEEYTTFLGPCRFCGTQLRYNYVILFPKKLKLGYTRENLQPVCSLCLPQRMALRNFIERKRGVDLES